MAAGLLRVAAVIPAAGRGRRFGTGQNKIWSELKGRAILEWTLAAFESHPDVAAIVVVAGQDELARIRELSGRYEKVRVVEGGATRWASVLEGITALDDTVDAVLVHDAARPLVSHELISRIILAVERTGAAVPGISLSDTIKRVDTGNRVRASIPRTAGIAGDTISGLTAVQTPQGVRLDLLRRAYDRFDFTSHEPTDESSLIEALGEPVEVVPGDVANVKITHTEDLRMAERLVGPEPPPECGEQSTPAPISARWVQPPEQGEIRTGIGYDVHAFASPKSGRKLMLGGVEIDHRMGLDGHSDADVLLHAVCDALLGGAGGGDIGILFPNSNPAYRNIASIALLEDVYSRIKDDGWRVINVDATLLAEAPKLAPYREAIERKIADTLEVDSARVCVKATTSERMGFVGREEGMACWAIATLRQEHRSQEA